MTSPRVSSTDSVPDHAPVVVATAWASTSNVSTPTRARDAGACCAHAGSRPERPYLFFCRHVRAAQGPRRPARRLRGDRAPDPDVELWLAGQPGWGSSEIEAPIAGHAAASRDPPTRLRATNRAAGVDAHGREWSCIPHGVKASVLPVLEALACGALVVTTREHRDGRGRRRRGAARAAGDASALGAVITAALEMADAQRASRRACRARAPSIFTWDASFARHLRGL